MMVKIDLKTRIKVLRGEVRHAHLLLDREERASERVTNDLWSLRQGVGRLCDMLGVSSQDLPSEPTDEETITVLKARIADICSVIGVDIEPLEHQDAIDRRREQIVATIQRSETP